MELSTEIEPYLVLEQDESVRRHPGRNTSNMAEARLLLDHVERNLSQAGKIQMTCAGLRCRVHCCCLCITRLCRTRRVKLDAALAVGQRESTNGIPEKRPSDLFVVTAEPSVSERLHRGRVPKRDVLRAATGTYLPVETNFDVPQGRNANVKRVMFPIINFHRKHPAAPCSPICHPPLLVTRKFASSFRHGRVIYPVAVDPNFDCELPPGKPSLQLLPHLLHILSCRLFFE